MSKALKTESFNARFPWGQEPHAVVRRRQFCARCGQLMFEFYRSPDGHFGLIDAPQSVPRAPGQEIRCPTCQAPYVLLDRVNSMGQPVERK
jgi:hypothetical protein